MRRILFLLAILFMPPLRAELQADHIEMVSDGDFSLRGKPAVTIYIGGNEKNWLEITLQRKDIKAGLVAEHQGIHASVPISLSATWEGHKYQFNPERGSTYRVEITEFNLKAKKAKILFGVKLSDDVAPLVLNGQVEITGQAFANLTKKR